MTKAKFITDRTDVIPAAVPEPISGYWEPLDYPIDSLGSILAPAATQIAEGVQCPPAIAAHSILGVAALATQGLADVEIDGRTHPLSLNLLTVAESGDRKSAADNVALCAVHNIQRRRASAYKRSMKDYERKLMAYDAARRDAVTKSKKSGQDAIEQALALLDEPVSPQEPQLLSEDPTIEGIHKSLRNGRPSQGLFSSEGGQFFGGHSMNKDNIQKTVTALSKLWDGQPIMRTRSGLGESFLAYDRRLSTHLMVQPIISSEIFASRLMREQGILARFLVAAPKTIAGERLYRVANLQDSAELARFHSRTEVLLDQVKENAEGELQLKRLSLTPDAKSAWIKLHDAIEKQLCDQGELASIKPAAAKMAEIVLRLAAIQAVYDDESMISSIHLGNAAKLADFYIKQQLVLHTDHSKDVDLRDANDLLEWIVNHGGELTADQFSHLPSATGARTAKRARYLLGLLVERNLLIELAKNQRGDVDYWRVHVRSDNTDEAGAGTVADLQI